MNSFISNINGQISVTSVAFFQIALSRALLLGLISASIGTVLYPRLASFDGDLNRTRNAFGIASRVNLLISVSIAAILILIARPLFDILYGTEYSPAATLFAILMVGVAVDIVASPTTQLMNGLGKPHITTVMTIVVVVPQIIVISLIVPSGNLIHIAWVTVGFLVASASLRILVVSRMFGISFSEMLIPRGSDVALINDRLRKHVFGRFQKQ